MKRTKAQPSLAGLLLIVSGMVLLSIVALSLASSGSLSRDTLKVLAAVAGAGVACLAIGAALSNRKR